MKLPKKKSKIFFLISFLLFSISLYKIVNVNSQVRGIQTRILPNTYIGEFEISNIEVSDLDETISKIEDSLINKSIFLYSNNDKYEYTLKELGITINKNEIIKNVENYLDEVDYWDLYNDYSKESFDKIVYDYKYIVNEDRLINVLEDLKHSVDTSPSNGKLVMTTDRQLIYMNENKGYSLDIESSKDVIKNNFSTNDYKDNLSLSLLETQSPESYSLINTKISSFTTTFDDSIDRKYNLIAGASYINGVIMEPGETFSFYKHAGPYNKKGYVSYLGLMGNGVCQVATTLYNAELLAGLTTVTRYNHGKKSVYVDGGLDATVSTDGSSITDFSFKNTLDYPIYISAFVDGGNLTIEFWSNENAMGGKTYKTESIKHGYGVYEALRHVYLDGEYLETEYLGMSYYSSE